MLPSSAFASLQTLVWDPIAPTSQGPWTVFMVTVFLVWAAYFVTRRKPTAIIRDEEARKDQVLALMKSVLDYTENQLLKPEHDRSMPEAKRVFALLYDDVHQRRTTALGFPASLPLNRRIEELFMSRFTAELKRAIELTRESRSFSGGHTAKDGAESTQAATDTTVSGRAAADAKESAKDVAEHESGEKLRETVEFARLARVKLGDAFRVDEALTREASELLKSLSVEQLQNFKTLFRLVRPVLPVVLATVLLGVLLTALRAKFHQLGVWIEAIEAGVAGDLDAASTLLFRLWVGHMLIKLLELPESTYKKRAKAYFGTSIRNGVLTAMISQDYEYFDRTPAGVLQDRLNRDADELGENLIDFPIVMLQRATWIACNLYIVYTQSPATYFGVALLPVVCMTIFQFFTFKFFRTCNERMRRVEEESVSATSEVLSNIKTVRQLANEPSAAASYARRGLARRLIGEKIFTIRRVAECFVWCVFDSGITLTIVFGLPFVASGQMTAGQLIDNFIKLNFHVNFCMREVLEELPRVTRLLEPMGRICDLLQATPAIEPPTTPAFVDAASPAELSAVLERCHTVTDTARGEQRTVVSSDALGGLTHAPHDVGSCPRQGAQLVRLATSDFRHVAVGDCRAIEPASLSYPVRAIFSNKLRPARFRGKIEFRDVHFAYPTDLRTPVLQGLSFTVEPGAKVALVGPTGCGKSSCMALLQRLYDPQRGTILLDDVPIQEYDVRYLRSRVVIVDQSTVLFSQTIADNLTYGIDRDVSHEEIVQACKDAQAWEFIEDKPDKLLTLLESGGSNLSGGQRQRLAIARAMLRRPDVILLDEATSALDNANEAKVQTALDALARRGSALVIAHRLSTIKDSDMIAVVDHGRVVESGTHDELLARCADSEAPEESFTAPPPDGRALPVPQRQKSAPSKTMTTGTATAATKVTTYRQLWDAASGGGASLSMEAIAAKIGAAEDELMKLRKKQQGMLQQKARLIEPSQPLLNAKQLSAEMADKVEDKPAVRKANEVNPGSPRCVHDDLMLQPVRAKSC